NDGVVIIQDSSPAGVTINSIVADAGGQAPTVLDGQVVVNTTPDKTPPTYAGSSGFPFVQVTSSGPVVVNSISSVGEVDIAGKYILEGNAQSPTVIAPLVNLAATGTAD